MRTITVDIFEYLDLLETKLGLLEDCPLGRNSEEMQELKEKVKIVEKEIATRFA
jgi:hypothetical protein